MFQDSRWARAFLLNFFKIRLSYQGSGYKGWQVQPHDKTVQGELNKSLEQMLKLEFRTLGSGRTDAGVHALAQIVRLETKSSISSVALFKGLNSLLPPDIRVLDVHETTSDFHPIFSAKSKEYWYLFSLTSGQSPFEAPLITRIKGDFDPDKAQELCDLFIGQHNFSHYFCVGTDTETTVREIYECEIVKIERDGHWSHLSLSGPYYYLRIRGNGFLKQMVRLIAGTVFKYARGQLELDDVKSSLRDQGRAHMAPVAPPQGLYLAEVFYE